MLGDFHLLDHLTQGGTITGTIFTNDSNLLGALGLSIKKKRVNNAVSVHFRMDYKVAIPFCCCCWCVRHGKDSPAVFCARGNEININ